MSFSVSREKKDLFNFNLKLGVNTSSFSINDFNNINDVDFDLKVYPRFGLELEFVLPFNNDAWALFFEPSFQKYSNSSYTDNELYKQEVVVHYAIVQIPIGFRYYHHLNPKSKLFTNASLNLAFMGDSGIKYPKGPDLYYLSANSYSVGLGYKYNDVLGMELRYELPNNLFRKYNTYSSSFQTVSLIFGYTLL